MTEFQDKLLYKHGENILDVLYAISLCFALFIISLYYIGLNILLILPSELVSMLLIITYTAIPTIAIIYAIIYLTLRNKQLFHNKNNPRYQVKFYLIMGSITGFFFTWNLLILIISNFADRLLISLIFGPIIYSIIILSFDIKAIKIHGSKNQDSKLTSAILVEGLIMGFILIFVFFPISGIYFGLALE